MGHTLSPFLWRLVPSPTFAGVEVSASVWIFVVVAAIAMCTFSALISADLSTKAELTD